MAFTQETKPKMKKRIPMIRIEMVVSFFVKERMSTEAASDLLMEKKLNLNIATAKRFWFRPPSLLVQTLPPFFCLPKRKEQRKRQPILMRNFSSPEHFPAKIGIQKPNCIEHFLSKIMQDGMSRLC